MNEAYALLWHPNQQKITYGFGGTINKTYNCDCNEAMTFIGLIPDINNINSQIWVCLDCVEKMEKNKFYQTKFKIIPHDSKKISNKIIPFIGYEASILPMIKTNNKNNKKFANYAFAGNGVYSLGLFPEGLENSEESLSKKWKVFLNMDSLAHEDIVFGNYESILIIQNHDFKENKNSFLMAKY